METLAALIARRNIRMTVKRASANPNIADSSNMTHWRCTLRSDSDAKIHVNFSMGIAHKGNPPTAADVLDCLASDASGVENACGFSEWCSEYGYSDDSRKAEKTYNSCQRVQGQLKRLLGADYKTLLFEIERL